MTNSRIENLNFDQFYSLKYSNFRFLNISVLTLSVHKEKNKISQFNCLHRSFWLKFMASGVLSFHHLIFIFVVHFHFLISEKAHKMLVNGTKNSVCAQCSSQAVSLNLASTIFYSAAAFDKKCVIGLNKNRRNNNNRNKNKNILICSVYISKKWHN